MHLRFDYLSGNCDLHGLEQTHSMVDCCLIDSFIHRNGAKAVWNRFDWVEL